MGNNKSRRKQKKQEIRFLQKQGFKKVKFVDIFDTTKDLEIYEENVELDNKPKKILQ